MLAVLKALTAIHGFWFPRNCGSMLFLELQLVKAGAPAYARFLQPVSHPWF
jgi:hypothetical protein